MILKSEDFLVKMRLLINELGNEKINSARNSFVKLLNQAKLNSAKNRQLSTPENAPTRTRALGLEKPFYYIFFIVDKFII